MAVPRINLNDGTTIPVIAFGTGTALFGKDSKDLVLAALADGYDSLDTAEVYANTASVGAALKEWKGKREDVYLLSKWGKATTGAVDEARTVLETMLQELGVDYVDMYLIHSPLLNDKVSLADQWKVMEKIKADGLAKAVGVSNFREEDLQEVLASNPTVVPAVNQIEFHPYLYHAPNVQRLTKLMKEHNIKIQTFGPLAPVFRSSGGPVDAVAERIATAHGLTVPQVLLKWASQFGGGTVVTTSRTEERRKEQLAAFTAPPLTDAEVQEIADAGKGQVYRKFMVHVWDAAKP